MAHEEIKFGSIVHHPNVPEPNGELAGPHYVVIIIPESEVLTASELLAAVITTSFTNPLRDGWFKIPEYVPGKPGGHQTTGLSQLSVVKMTWLVSLPKEEIKFNKKHISVPLARELKRWLEDKMREVKRHRKK